jgi:hypothetical protein
MDSTDTHVHVATPLAPAIKLGAVKALVELSTRPSASPIEGTCARIHSRHFKVDEDVQESPKRRRTVSSVKEGGHLDPNRTGCRRIPRGYAEARFSAAFAKFEVPFRGGGSTVDTE